jgi:hypothetical protein
VIADPGGGRGQIGFFNGGHLERGRGWAAGAGRLAEHA